MPLVKYQYSSSGILISDIVAGRSMVHNIGRLLRRHFCGDNCRRARDGDRLLDIRPVEFPRRYGIHAGSQVGHLLALVLAPDHTVAHDRHINLYVRHLQTAHV